MWFWYIVAVSFHTEVLFKWEKFSLKKVVVFSLSFMSTSLQPHGLQHARLPCPWLAPGVYSNSCLLNRWCHPTISSSVVLFSSCLQSFPTSGSIPVSQFFTSGGQIFEASASASASVLPMHIQGWFPLGFDWLVLLAVQGTLKSLLQYHSLKTSVLQCLPFFIVQLSHLYMTTGKTIALTIRAFDGKVMSLLFNMLSRFVIAFPPRRSLLISCLQSPSTVILESRK